MAQFQVPQFIETEDKIIGPFTLRQFIYIAIAGGISALGFLIFGKLVAIIIALILMGTAALLAFVKVNGRDVSYFILSAFNYFWNKQVYIFKVETDDKSKAFSESHNDVSSLREIGEKLATSKSAVPKRELALPPSGKPIDQKEVKERYEIVQNIEGSRQAARRVDYR